LVSKSERIKAEAVVFESLALAVLIPWLGIKLAAVKINKKNFYRNSPNNNKNCSFFCQANFNSYKSNIYIFSFVKSRLVL